MYTIILIAGGSCSGKTVLAKSFQNALCVEIDHFYLPKDTIPVDEQGNYDFDRPESLDLALCAQAIRKLSQGEAVQIPQYDFRINDRVGQQTLTPAPSTRFIVVEGLFAFYPPLLELGNVKLFLDTPTEIRLARRMVRDLERKGKTKLETLTNFISIEKSYMKYVEPTKKDADVILPFSPNPLALL